MHYYIVILNVREVCPVNTQAVLDRYVSFCRENLQINDRVPAFLMRHGITQAFVIETFGLGHAAGTLPELAGGNETLARELEAAGPLKNGREVFSNHLTIPVFDAVKVLVNVLGYNLHPRAKTRLVSLSSGGIFNAPFLSRVTVRRSSCARGPSSLCSLYNTTSLT